MRPDEWAGCYGKAWGGLIVGESVAHPAKYSRALIERIYNHIVEEGWVKPGSLVIDPFGGVGLGALYAMKHGLNWVGVELEANWAALGNQNIERWRKLYPRMKGSAVVLNGDSRRLLEVIGVQGAAVVSSPPYSGISPEKSGPGIDIEKQWQTYRSQGGGMGLEKFKAQQMRHAQGYGSSSSNLGNLPPGSFAAAVGSPPHGTTRLDDDQRRASSGVKFGNPKWYGLAPGQLAAMREGTVDAALSSPPYEGSMNCGEGGIDWKKAGRPERTAPSGKRHGVQGASMPQRYSESGTNLGNQTGDTFWTAGRTILEQTHAALKPGGVAVWVLKQFVRAGKIVEFPDQWRQLCEAVGFVTLHEHHALLTEHKGKVDLFTGKEKTVARKSFFRRLAESNGSPAIDFEVILCMGKRP